MSLRTLHLCISDTELLRHIFHELADTYLKCMAHLPNYGIDSPSLNP